MALATLPPTLLSEQISKWLYVIQQHGVAGFLSESEKSIEEEVKENPSAYKTFREELECSIEL